MPENHGSRLPKEAQITNNSKKPTYVLGIGCFYHDASATLIRDGKIVAAAAEERFTRIKHDSNFPTNAIKYCMEFCGISADDLNYVGFYEKPLLKIERILFQHLAYFPHTLGTFIKTTPTLLGKKMRLAKALKKEIKYRGDVIYVEHHLAHAASSFYSSSFEDAAVLVVDGVGEFACTSWGIGHKNEVRLINEICFPHSLGLFYSTITAYLGFAVNNDEYKVMGLAAYGSVDGQTNPYYKKMKKIIKIADDGSYALDMSFFSFQYGEKMPSQEMCNLLGGPIRENTEILTRRHHLIAAAAQMVLEEALLQIFKHLHEETQLKNIVFSGGVALNSVCNSKILSQSGFENVWINPDPGDGGASMGVALYINHAILKNKRICFETPYLGPEFSTKEIKAAIDERKLKYTYYQNINDVLRQAAKLIGDNYVIGWFQGRMEWGPRALGNRSILANASNPEMKDILNRMVKHRESFRPFAPAVCEEETGKYFETESLSQDLARYMLTISKVNNDQITRLPSITHVDHTARVQTVSEENNPIFYNLIKQYGTIYGDPVIINTSLNVNGEPIVCTPQDAINTFLSTEIDHIFIGNFLLSKIDNSILKQWKK